MQGTAVTCEQLSPYLESVQGTLTKRAQGLVQLEETLEGWALKAGPFISMLGNLRWSPGTYLTILRTDQKRTDALAIAPDLDEGSVGNIVSSINGLLRVADSELAEGKKPATASGLVPRFDLKDGFRVLQWARPRKIRRKSEEAKSSEQKEIVQATDRRLSAIENIAKEKPYCYPGGYVSAIRLFGAQAECFQEERVHFFYEHTALEIDPDLAEMKEKHIAMKVKEAEAKGKQFFNGPNTRLLRWRANPRNDSNVGREEPVLEIHLGPCGWYDYEGLNGAVRTRVGPTAPRETLDYYLGLEDLLTNGSVGQCKLSNIIGTATTIVSSDGYVGFQKRSDRPSAVPRALTSSVAENINRFRDEAKGGKSKDLVHPEDLRERKEKVPAPSDYKPVGVPHPFAAARRGIRDELSPSLLQYVTTDELKLIGLDFDLASFHPDFLFIALFPIPHMQILQACREDPGVEYHEGQLGFVPADLSNKETKELLAVDTWIPSGKASLVRTLEIIRVLIGQGMSWDDSFKILAQ